MFVPAGSGLSAGREARNAARLARLAQENAQTIAQIADAPKRDAAGRLRKNGKFVASKSSGQFRTVNGRLTLVAGSSSDW